MKHGGYSQRVQLFSFRFCIKSDSILPLTFHGTFFSKQTPQLSVNKVLSTVWVRRRLSEEPGSAGAECSTCIQPLNYSVLWIIESRHSFLGPRLGAPATQLPTVWNVWGRREIGEERSRSFELERWDNWLPAQWWMFQNRISLRRPASSH